MKPTADKKYHWVSTMGECFLQDDFRRSTVERKDLKERVGSFLNGENRWGDTFDLRSLFSIRLLPKPKYSCTEHTNISRTQTKLRVDNGKSLIIIKKLSPDCKNKTWRGMYNASVRIDVSWFSDRITGTYLMSWVRRKTHWDRIKVPYSCYYSFHLTISVSTSERLLVSPSKNLCVVVKVRCPSFKRKSPESSESLLIFFETFTKGREEEAWRYCLSERLSNILLDLMSLYTSLVEPKVVSLTVVL